MKIKLKNIFQKKATYIILLAVFTLLMAADIAIYALVPSATSLPDMASGSMPDFSSSESMPDFSSTDGMQPPTTEQSEGTAASDSAPAQAGTDAAASDGAAAQAETDAAASDSAAAEQSSSDASGESAGSSMPDFDGSFPTAAGSSQSGFLSKVKQAFWPILIVCLLADGACIFMLIRLRRRDEDTEVSEEVTAESDDDDSPRRSKRLPISFAILAVLVVAIIALLPSGSTTTEATANEELLSGTAEVGDIDTTYRGSGTLTDSDAEAITIPDTVELLGYTVRNGDAVEAGDVLATVDRNSVMETIASLQSAMDDLDADIQSAKSDSISSTLTATAAGRVMKIYAESGVSVQDTMYEHGALMLISLDGLLAIDIDSSDTDLAEGDAVTVVLSDDSEIEGTVARIIKGTAKITVADNEAAYGESVTVKTESGAELGEGELYISSELKVTGFAGTASKIYVSEGSKVSSGQSLIALSDTDYSGNYSSLLEQREEYSELLTRLLKMYEEGYIRAENDGIVTGISDSAEYIELSESTTASAASAASSGGSSGEGGGVTLLLNIVSSEPQITLLSSETQTDGGDGTDADEGNGSDGSADQTTPTDPTTPTEPSEQTEQSTYTIRGTVESITEDEETGKKTLKLRGIDTTYDVTELELEEGIEAGAEVTLTFDTSTNKLLGVKLSSSDSGEQPDSDSSFEMPSGGSSAGIMSGSSTESEEEEFSITEVEVCSLIPEDTMTVTVSVDELDVLSLSVGQTAEVSLDALPGQSFTGTVTSLNTTGTNAGGSTKYEMTVTIDRAEQMLGGMNASVSIVTASKEGVLTVSANAVYEENGKTYVYTGCNDKTNELESPVEVTTGATDGENIEILDGLSEGDSYYYLYADSLTIA